MQKIFMFANKLELAYNKYNKFNLKHRRNFNMRIDKYLKVSRLIKRRTVANEVADAGRIMVNGRPVKASYQVKVGDIIEVGFGNREMKAKVLSLDEPRGKDIAREMYELVE